MRNFGRIAWRSDRGRSCTRATCRSVGELEALIDRYPYRERLIGQLMLALYRSRRQAEALAAYRRSRDRLVDELGIEPGPELRSLASRVLNQDPGLAGLPHRPASGR